MIGEAPKKKGHRKLLCKCDCGNVTTVDAGNLRSGHTKTCGHCERYTYVGNGEIRCTLPSGQTFLFDVEDMPVVRKHKWSIENSGYVHTTSKGKHMRLHQVLMSPYVGVVDHINGDKTDNRRCNLRVASNKENVRNQCIGKRNTSGFKGVSFDRRRNKYTSQITSDGVNHFLGYYEDPVNAAVAYDKAAAFYFGEFAKPNFGEGGCYEQVLEVGA